MDEKILIKTERLKITINTFKYPFLAVFVCLTFLGIFLPKNGNFLLFVTLPAILVALVFSGTLLLFRWIISKNQLIVTDKRISGKAAFGKQIDLPIDSISSVGTIKLIKGLSISTASGNVSFWGIGNRDEIYKVISDLIIARQTKSSAKEEKTTNNSDYTEELKKIKDLLDAGIITQEEFDAKKKQILGL